MPIRRDLYDRMIAEHEAGEREADRFRLWYHVRTILVCLLWQGAGAALVVYAFHAVMPAERAHDLINGGLGIAAAGTLLTVMLRAAWLKDRGY